eukprot:scaffold161143_cov23-Cyclotella_meneghiniana.AAC.1
MRWTKGRICLKIVVNESRRSSLVVSLWLVFKPIRQWSPNGLSLAVHEQWVSRCLNCDLLIVKSAIEMGLSRMASSLLCSWRCSSLTMLRSRSWRRWELYWVKFITNPNSFGFGCKLYTAFCSDDTAVGMAEYIGRGKPSPP